MPTRCARACACGAIATIRGQCPTCAARMERRRSEEAGRQWYQTPRWRQLRALVLKEAGHVCQCEACAQTGRATAANTVDHIRPHRGDPALFWNRRNLQAMSAECHSAKTAGEVNARGRVI